MGGVRLPCYTGDGLPVAALENFGHGAEVFYRGVIACGCGTACAVSVAWSRGSEGQREEKGW